LSNVPWLKRLAKVALALALASGLALGQTTTAPARKSKTSSKTTKSAQAAKSKSNKAAKPAPAKVFRKNSRKKTNQRAQKSKQAGRARGQRGIDPARAAEIQQALIRERYLAGEASGSWDQRTKDAMARYQADHGWQTKVLPDARALIKLGLGPDHSHLINPETAATTSATVTTAGRQ